LAQRIKNTQNSSSSKIKFPPLEKKVLGLDKKELAQRQEEVENYFNIVLNEKIYFPFI
jgi:hypothetical protein